MVRRRKILVFEVLALAFVVVWSVLTVAASQETVLRIAVNVMPNLDPALGADFASCAAFVNLYEPLVSITREGDIAPQVADNWHWDMEEDTAAYVLKVHVRQGTRFHDNTELRAEDVAFSMERILAIGSGFSYLFRDRVESVEIVDDYTVQFRLNEPFGPFLSALLKLYILNKDGVLEHIKPGPYGDYGDYGIEYLRTHDCGSGPYIVKEVCPGEYLHIERFAEYWEGACPDSPNEIRFISGLDDDQLVHLMQMAELDIVAKRLPAGAFEALTVIEGISGASFFTGDILYLMLNTLKFPTNNIHFRKGISWGFDYARAVETIFPGSRQAIGPIARIVPGHGAHVQVYELNPEKAEEELRLFEEETGVNRSEYPLKYHWIRGFLGAEAVALLFQYNMAQLGIIVEIVETTWPVMLGEITDSETTAHINSVLVGPDYPEAGSILERKYHSSYAGTWASTEWFHDPVTDFAIENVLALIDVEDRHILYEMIQDDMSYLCPDIFVIEHSERYTYQDYVKWPQAHNPFPLMEWNIAGRFIQLHHDRE